MYAVFMEEGTAQLMSLKRITSKAKAAKYINPLSGRPL
ncbi:MAG: hypothetical protein DF168_00029 [Candidatus Moanabacter tarae]|uniref:Uncharacterized protein n=1 Tax=Candidatus Moanibacter tarae TaxID=2200854 RepID=A0A2Z4AG50_9BACT|nr:MAG: hypothetical protein DF168_00029 [Candidatus Moanabacter tarae]